MNKLFTSSILAVALLGLTANAAPVNTNTITAPAITLADTNADKGMPMELTLGGSGVTSPKTGATEFGLDFSLSVQPLSQPIWFGISQELGWSPSLEGATDLDAAWSFLIIKDRLYLNAGWSGGVTYDRSSIAWRTGPELSLEYYTSGNAFIIVGANYDLFTHTASGGWETAQGNPLRYFAGIGIAF